MDDDKKYLIRGSIINALGNVTKVASPLLTLLLARFFPEDQFGYFISLQLFVLTVSRFSVLGLDKGLLWYIPSRKSSPHLLYKEIQACLNVSLVLAVLFVVLFVLGYYLKIPPFDSSSNHYPWQFYFVFLFSLIPYTYVYIGSSALEAIRKPQYKIFINQFLMTSLVPILAVLFSYLGAEIYSLSLGFTVATVLTSAIYFFLLRIYFPVEKFLVWSVSRELFKYSLPMMFVEIVTALLLRTDLWMVLYFLGPKKAAVYGIVLTLVNSLKTIRQSFDSLLIPIVSNMNFGVVPKQLKEIYSYATNMVSTIQLIITPAILLFPDVILSIAGKQYSEGGLSLGILLIGNLLNGYFGLSGNILLGMGKSIAFLLSCLVSLLINICLNAVLIPRYGITGAASASVVAYSVQNFIALYLQHKITKINLYEKYLWVNGFFILLILIWVGFFFQTTSEMSYPIKILVFFAVEIVFLSVVWWKRETYSLKEKTV